MFVLVRNASLVLLNETHFLFTSILPLLYQFQKVYFETNLKEAGSECNNNQIILKQYETILKQYNFSQFTYSLF